MSRRRSRHERERTFVALDLDCGSCGQWLDRAWMYTDGPEPDAVVHFLEDERLGSDAVSRIKGRSATDQGEALLQMVRQGPEPLVRVYTCNRCPGAPQRSIDDVRRGLLAVWQQGLHSSWRIELR